MPLHRHSAVARALDAVDTRNGSGGMGFLPLLIPLVGAGASAYAAHKQAGAEVPGIDPAQLALEKRRMMAEQAAGGHEAAGAERGKVLRYALIGGGVLLLLGGVGLFAWSRRKKNPGRRRGRRRR